ncbi:hypothetical protein LguiA_002484 [Lonicera macranthoides]
MTKEYVEPKCSLLFLSRFLLIILNFFVHLGSFLILQKLYMMPVKFEDNL